VIEFLNIPGMNITIFSNVCIDHNKTKTGSYTAAGSPAMFFARIFRYFPQVQTTIISAYGINFLTYIHDIGILPKNPTAEKTLIYENDTRGTSRKQKAFNWEISAPPKIDSIMRGKIAYSDAIIIAPIVPNFSAQYIKKIFTICPPACLKILSPQGFFRSFTPDHSVVRKEFNDASEIIRLFDYVILSNEDYPHIEKIAKDWVKNSQAKILITLAEKGALLIGHQSEKLIPTQPVTNIVNSVGAGDIFTASFVYKFLQTNNEEKSIRFAHKIAGFCLQFTPDKIKLTCQVSPL
jgi:hypothetical protein